jgi:pimeloyl-ACP methyl ester carboxylesterase
VPPVTEETIQLDEQPVFLRRAGDSGFAGTGTGLAGTSTGFAGTGTGFAGTGTGFAGTGDPAPILYLHGLPTSSFDWLGPLALGGGIAVDLPGFGLSGKRGDLDYSLTGHVAFVGRLLEALGIDRVRLCLHDWGAAVGLAWAAAQPERVERLVVINGVPLLAGFRWRGWARAVRTPLVGPIAVGFATPRMVRRISRGASAGDGPMAAPFLQSISEHMDLGTERALLRLLRSATPQSLAEAGAGLGAITAPALVLCGAKDPWIVPRFSAGTAATLGDATLETIEGAGHWPWLDRPELSERIIRHLDGEPPSPAGSPPPT